MSTSKKLIIAAVLMVLGVILMVMPTPGEPAVECAAEGGPTSGFADEDQAGCPITIESYNEYREWSTGPRWDNIAGLVLVVGGLAFAGTVLVRDRRAKKRASSANHQQV